MSYRFAALTSGLLARKGAAQPAMATHSGGNPRMSAEPPPPVVAEPPFRPAAVLARAGYAYEAPPLRPVPLPAAAPVEAAEPAAVCTRSTACAIEAAGVADPARRFHVSVRLRQSHFVRLKIASAQLRKPSQDIVADALSAYFRTLDPNVFGDCACARE